MYVELQFSFLGTDFQPLGEHVDRKKIELSSIQFFNLIYLFFISERSIYSNTSSFQKYIHSAGYHSDM